VNSEPKKVNNGTVVVSPTDTGYALVRMFVGNGENLQNLKSIQETLNCIEYNDS
jgi:tRNA A37 threonylcarbamoyladenosine synthetase subunit TsaC/SUA5/YrdC